MKKIKKPEDTVKNIKINTFTKFFTALILIVCLIDLQLSYILAFLGMEQIAESLSTQLCVTILGTAFAYMVRAFFDTKEENNTDKLKENIRGQFEENVKNAFFDAGIDEPEGIFDIDDGPVG